jgi:hypothetical protein
MSSSAEASGWVTGTFDSGSGYSSSKDIAKASGLVLGQDSKHLPAAVVASSPARVFALVSYRCLA